MTHTATPWICRTAQNFNIGTQDGYAIADMAFDYSSISRKELEANAAFIVKACNSHDDLVKALQDLFNHGHLICFVSDTQEDIAIKSFAIAALAKAQA